MINSCCNHFKSRYGVVSLILCMTYLGQNVRYISLPFTKSKGVLWALLSVCVFVNRRTNCPILMKYGQIVYNHNKVKVQRWAMSVNFQDHSHLKKSLEIMNTISRLFFSIYMMSKLHSWCKTRQFKRNQSPVAMITKMYVNIQWLLAYHYCHPPCTLGLSNIGLGLYLDGWPLWYVYFCW